MRGWLSGIIFRCQRSVPGPIPGPRIIIFCDIAGHFCPWFIQVVFKNKTIKDNMTKIDPYIKLIKRGTYISKECLIKLEKEVKNGCKIKNKSW